MKKTYIKFLKRSVWKSKARFLSILAIVAIGVGFLGGLLATTPNMQLTLDTYYDENKVYDLDVKGSMGITTDDIATISKMDEIESTTPAYVTDLLMEDADGAYVTRLYGMQLGENVENNFKLIDGRMPESKNECVLAIPNSYSLNFAPGEKFTISADNNDYDKIADTYAFTEVTTVGIVETPLHYSITADPSTVGSGEVQLIMFMQTDAYSMEVFTDAFIRLKKSTVLNTFSDEYESITDAFAAQIETLGAERSKLRRSEVVATAEEKLKDAKDKYDTGKKKADKELTAAKKKIDNAKRDIAENKVKIADGKKELQDGKLKLIDAKEKIASGESELSTGWAEIEKNQTTLDNSTYELDNARTELKTTIAKETTEFKKSIPKLADEQYSELVAKIDTAEKDGTATLDKNETALEEGEQQIATAEKTIKKTEEEIETGYAQLAAGQAEYDKQNAIATNSAAELKAASQEFITAIAEQRASLEAIKDTITEEEYLAATMRINEEEKQKIEYFDSKFAELKAGEDILAETAESLSNSKRQLDAGKSQLQAGKDELTAKKSALRDGKIQLAAGRKQLKDEIAKNRKELLNSLPTIKAEIEKQGLQKIEDARIEAQVKIDSGAEELATGSQTLADAKSVLYNAENDLAAAKIEIADAEITIADNEKEIIDGEKKLINGEIELADGEKTYKKEKMKAETELADAQNKIDDAAKKINDIKLPEWMVLTRNDNVSFNSYKSDSAKIGAIATIFPFFFFLVAALVALTTMTRLVEEERTQIGVFKALGYSNRIITLYYLGYSTLASLLGSVIGIVAGFYTLPVVISNAFNMTYSSPPLILHFWWNYALIIIPCAILCTTISSLSACLNQLRDKPSDLMLPKAPQIGKRIFLEKIVPLWKHFSFTQKITARNIFRYKRRFFMTIIGIAGCSALLVTGFGIRDSINDIGKKQFGEIYNYDLTLTLSEAGAAESDSNINTLLNDKKYISSYEEIHSEGGAYINNSACTILVPKHADKLSEQINLRTLKSGSAIEFNENSVVIAQKISEQLNVGVGDTLPIKTKDGYKGEVTVTGVAENYVSDYVFISPEIYEKVFSNRPLYKQVFAILSDENLKDEFSEKMLANDNALIVMFNQTIANTFNNTVRNIDYIVLVLIISAGALAMIVLYNLTNINICERKKELATIKVLGFHSKEVAFYIYRETLILCIIGIVVGLVLGIFLHSFVIRTAEVGAVMFGRNIYPLSYLYAGTVTLFFTLLVDIIMLKKIRRIDMVESMKANE